jgi:hypothetical protein
MKPDGWILGILENVHYSDATNLSGEIAHYGKTGQMETDQGPTTLLDNLSSIWFSLRLGLIIVERLSPEAFILQSIGSPGGLCYKLAA